jgi:RND family efflux transporter MFP subunit
MKRNTILIISAGLLFACSPAKEKPVAEGGISTRLSDKISEVKALRLDYTDFSYELLSNGTISAVRKADLRFQSAENIARIYVKNGDRVEKGQKIAELEQFKLQNSLNQATDNMEKARLELQDVLIGQGYSLNDTARIPADVMKIAKIKSNYDQSLNNRQLAEYNLNSATLYAPFDGSVANMTAKEYNQASASETFCTVIDYRQPEAILMILESELPVVKPGGRVLITPFSITDYTCEGRITEINPAVNKNGMVRIKASVNDPSGRLYDGMNVKVRIQHTQERRLVIPKEALVLRNNKKVVFTLKNGQAQWVYVQTGAENATGYVVTEGLAAGDSVIFEGNINLAHEAEVKTEGTKN